MTEESAPKRSRGRPRVYPGTEKRPTLTLRVRDGLHQKLIEAAEARERSLSEEMERRLVESFATDASKKATLLRVLNNVLAPVAIPEGQPSYFVDRSFLSGVFEGILLSLFPNQAPFSPLLEITPELEALADRAFKLGVSSGERGYEDDLDRTVAEQMEADREEPVPVWDELELSLWAQTPGPLGKLARAEIAKRAKLSPKNDLPPPPPVEPASAPKPKAKKAKPLERRDLDARVAELAD